MKKMDTDLPGTVVTHGAAGMAAVKDPAEVLGELIRRVDDTGQVAHDNVALLAPFLDSEVLYIDMTGTFGRAGGVDHIDGCLVIFMKDGGAGLGKAKFVEDSTKILGDFGGMNGGDEFSFSRAGGDGRLDLGLVGNGSASKAEAETGDGSASSRAGGVRGIDKTSELERCKTSGETRKRGVSGQSSV